MAKKELCRDLNFKMSAILGPVILMYVVAFPLGDDVGVQVLDDLFTYIWALAHQALGLNFIILCTTQVSYVALFWNKKKSFCNKAGLSLSTILYKQRYFIYNYYVLKYITKSQATTETQYPIKSVGHIACGKIVCSNIRTPPFLHIFLLITIQNTPSFFPFDI